MVLKGVLFDLDGTLIDFKINFTKARKKVIEILEEEGFPKDRLTPKMLIIPMIEMAKDYFFAEFRMTQKVWNGIQKKLNKHIEAVEREASYHATIRKGMKELSVTTSFQSFNPGR